MSPTDVVPLLVALVLGTFTLIRIPSLVLGQNTALWIAHALIVGCLLLAVTPIYVAIDGILGGTNLTNLISHLAFPLIFLAGCRQVAQSVARPDLEHKISQGIGLFALLTASCLTTAFFVLADTPATSMGLNGYREDPWVIAYKAASFVYPAYCSALLVPMLLAESRNSGTPGIHRWAKGLMGTGFVLVVPVPVIHLAEFMTAAARVWVDLFIYTAILLVAVGPLLALVARKRRDYGRARATV